MPALPQPPVAFTVPPVMVMFLPTPPLPPPTAPEYPDNTLRFPPSHGCPESALRSGSVCGPGFYTLLHCDALFCVYSSNTVPSFRFPALCYPPITYKVPRRGIFTIYPTGVYSQVDNIIFLYYFMREFSTIAIFKIKADIRMNKTTLNSQKEKHSMLSLRRATRDRCM